MLDKGLKIICINNVLLQYIVILKKIGEKSKDTKNIVEVNNS